jgi:hypothetical protein
MKFRPVRAELFHADGQTDMKKLIGDLQKVGGGHGDWMELAQDRDRWRALVGTVRNFRVP